MKIFLALCFALAQPDKVEAISSRHAAPPAPAPAGAPGPAPSINALHLSFEITNYNYYDLTKQTCPKRVKILNAGLKGKFASAKHKDPLDDQMERTAGEIGGHLNKLDKDFHKGIGDIVKGKKKVPPVHEDLEPDPEDIPHPDEVLPPVQPEKENSLLQKKVRACAMTRKKLSQSSLKAEDEKCETVADVFRKGIKAVVEDILECVRNQMSLAPAPAVLLKDAPAPAVLVPLPAQGFLQTNTHGAAPAPAVAAPPAAAAAAGPKVGIFVTFKPGREVGAGRSIIVEIVLTDTPGNGIDDLAQAHGILDQGLGDVHEEVGEALQIITGIKPKISNMGMAVKPIEAWNIAKCEGHIKTIVDQFGKTYTKAQVPMALYNECTNFVTKLSFSHDLVLDPADTLACRKSTARFAKHWEHGENAEDKDFEFMCVRACESKFGKNAPACNVHAGDELAGAPLL